MRKAISVLLLFLPALLIAQTLTSYWEVKLRSQATGKLVPGKDVDLYQNGSKVYDLTESSTTPGVYYHNAVANGEYDIYVDGLSWKTGVWIGSNKLSIIANKFTSISSTGSSDTLKLAGQIQATTFIGDGSGLTGIASGTGGVTNAGSTTVGADTDLDGVGEIALQTKGLTRMTVKNDGKIEIDMKYGGSMKAIQDEFDERGLNPANFVSIEAAIDTAVARGGHTLDLTKKFTIASSARDTIPASVTLRPVRGGGLQVTRKLRIEGAVIDPGPTQWIFGNIDSLEFAPGSVGYVRPEWVGAVGDSTTDDYAYFKAAIISSGANTLLLAEKHYLLGNKLGLKSNTSIIGLGTKKSTIDFIDDGSANPPNIYLSNVENVVIKDLRIKSSNASSRTGTKGLINIDSTSFVLIENVIFDNSSSTALWTRASSHITVKKAQVYNTYADGFHFSRATHNVLVEDSYFNGTADDAISAVGYIDSTIQRAPNRNIKYINNEIRNSGARGIVIMGTVGAFIAGNEIHNSQKAGILVGATMSGDSVQANRDITITGNKIYSSGLGSVSAISGIYISYVRGFEVSNCRIDSANGDGVTVTFSALDGDVNGNKISNAIRGINVVQVSSSVPRVIKDLAIAVGDTGRSNIGIENINIIGNKIYRNQIDGIYVTGESSLKAQNVILSKNMVYNNNTTNASSVRNLFFNHVKVGKMDNNISLPAANNYSITHYGDANSSDIEYIGNYPAGLVDQSVRGRMFNNIDTIAVSVTNTWYIFDGMNASQLNGVSFLNDSLIVPSDGQYLISFTSNLANELGHAIEVGLGFNGASVGDADKVRDDFSANSQYYPQSLSIIKNLNSGDSVYLMARNITGTGNIFIKNANLVLLKIN